MVFGLLATSGQCCVSKHCKRMLLPIKPTDSVKEVGGLGGRRAVSISFSLFPSLFPSLSHSCPLFLSLSFYLPLFVFLPFSLVLSKEEIKPPEAKKENGKQQTVDFHSELTRQALPACMHNTKQFPSWDHPPNESPIYFASLVIPCWILTAWTMVMRTSTLSRILHNSSFQSIVIIAETICACWFVFTVVTWRKHQSKHIQCTISQDVMSHSLPLTTGYVFTKLMAQNCYAKLFFENVLPSGWQQQCNASQLRIPVRTCFYAENVCLIIFDCKSLLASKHRGWIFLSAEYLCSISG